jgi:hypothetical protein
MTHFSSILVSAAALSPFACVAQSSSGKASANFMETHMSYLFALLHKLVPNFDEANLPLDSDYSYQARRRDDRRLRELRANIAWFRI